MNLYHDLLMDHYRHPRNQKKLENADFCHTSDNPLCGDTVTMCGRVAEGKVIELAFQGAGCVLSQAVGSLLTQELAGQSIEQVRSLTAEFIIQKVGMPLGPTRVKCALLPLEALQKGLSKK